MITLLAALTFLSVREAQDMCVSCRATGAKHNGGAGQQGRNCWRVASLPGGEGVGSQVASCVLPYGRNPTG